MIINNNRPILPYLWKRLDLFQVHRRLINCECFSESPVNLMHATLPNVIRLSTDQLDQFEHESSLHLAQILGYFKNDLLRILLALAVFKSTPYLWNTEDNVINI